MKWATIGLLAATVEANKFSFGSCKSVDYKVITQGKKHNEMQDTYYQVAESNVNFFGGEVTGWVDACTRHEFIRLEDYPIFNWQMQTQTSLFLWFFPTFSGMQYRWTYADHKADGWCASINPLGMYPDYNA